MANTKLVLHGLTHTKKRMLKDARYRASKKNLPFTLTINDIHIPEKCPVFGFKLTVGSYRRAPSLDRIIPELGYVRGNVIVVSNLANRLKADVAINQLRLVADFYENLLRTLHENNGNKKPTSGD